NTPETGFDCSGLVRYVYNSTLGLALPRTSRAMGRIDAPRVTRDALDAGDLVFFHGRSSRISHVGIYVGKGRFVHAPNSGGKVRLDRLDNPYWSRHFSFGRRPLSP
ncbi:MAG: C40 family peptidase, partial [Rhodanobacteraceae bacterium]